MDKKNSKQEFFHMSVLMDFHSEIDKITLSQLSVIPQGLGCRMNKI